MSKQRLIALGREFGSGGHEIARKLAKRLDLPLYDKNLLDKIAEEQNGDPELLRQYDEKPKIAGIHRVVDGLSNAPGDQIAQMQFDYLRARAAEGKSFVVLGRCADEVLEDYPGLISIFILADEASKLERTMTRDAIMDGVWGQEFSRENRTLDVHVRTLRTKLGPAGHYIETVRGVGYKIGGQA